jgi:hypothetical protein
LAQRTSSLLVAAACRLRFATLLLPVAAVVALPVAILAAAARVAITQVHLSDQHQLHIR